MVQSRFLHFYTEGSNIVGKFGTARQNDAADNADDEKNDRNQFCLRKCLAENVSENVVDADFFNEKTLDTIQNQVNHKQNAGRFDFFTN